MLRATRWGPLGLALALLTSAACSRRTENERHASETTSTASAPNPALCAGDLECARARATHELRTATRAPEHTNVEALRLTYALAGAYGRRDCAAADLFVRSLGDLPLDDAALPSLRAQRALMLEGHRGACGAITIAPTAPALGTDRLSLYLNGCYGECPRYTITVHGSGLVEYEGQAYVRTQGKQKATIPQEDAQRLFAAAERLHFATMDLSATDGTDSPKAEITLVRGKQEIHKRDEATCWSTQGMESGHCWLTTQLESVAKPWVQ
jgi:hypothetical protein